MNPIGGYFELELSKGEEYHKKAIKLNSGRNAFEYILRARGYRKVYLPYYTCDVILEPINKLELEFEFYHINEQLEPIFDFNEIGKDETFVYTNYFGIKGQAAKRLSNICPNLIIDNSQAFFEDPIQGIDTFYSPRKFFGVPDGAYLYTDKLLQIELEHDNSTTRFLHLIKRIDEGAEIGYATFKENEDSIKGQKIKLMSTLTKALLCNIDYDKAIKARKQNFIFLNKNLESVNKLKLPEIFDFVPMVYPFLSYQTNLKQQLIDNKIYLATYWPNVLEWCTENQLEYNITKGILNLPLDQRYNESDMMKIVSYMKL
ncbi:MAG: hypothetical protein RBT49_00475 [Bacteroidales bacterium]|jgi:hypothetical protein|nr:hypothetical protein [Bacteroidales bacterium]